MNRQYDHLSQKAYAAFQKRWWIGVPALLLAACLGYLLSQRPSLSEVGSDSSVMPMMPVLYIELVG